MGPGGTGPRGRLRPRHRAHSRLPGRTLHRCAQRLSGAANGLDEADRDVLLLLATHASLALATTNAVTRAELQAANLRKAIDSRDVIGQAKGIIMARRGVSAEEAFDVLRRTSQDLNVKLSELASTLTTRHTEIVLPTA